MMSDGLDRLPEHYETHLGAIVRGWSDDRQHHGVQVVSFDDRPIAGVRTYATLGLSRKPLRLSGNRTIRQEILMSANNGFAAEDVAALLLSIADHALGRNRALLRGEVIGPSGPVIAGSGLTAIYVANPSPFDDSFVQFSCAPPALVFAYLIPITSSEATLVEEKGWSWFEGRLEDVDPDIWNLHRSEAISIGSG